ncbi:MAG: hypothetical protein ABFD62_08830 [Syntrophaceae bacterium]
MAQITVPHGTRPAARPAGPQAVTFPNRDRLRLFGILHLPQGPCNRTGIILLCPGVKNRVAPQRLYVKMAKRFCSLGFAVLRFDFHGIGDSEGKIEEELAADFYGTVQAGRYIDDTLAAMDWMQADSGMDSFIIAGLCGGAITGLLAGARDRRIRGLLALGIPVIINGKGFDPAKYITRGQLDRIRGKYIAKLGDASSWMRLITLRSDYRKIFKSLCAPLLHSVNKKDLPEKKTDKKINDSAGGAAGNLNPLFRPAFEQMLESGRRVIFIFSGSDRLQWEFEEKFAADYDMGQWQGMFRKHTIPEANHVLSFTQWQEAMLDIACDWLKPYMEADKEMHARAQHSF